MTQHANIHHSLADAEADLYLLSSLCNRLTSKSYHSFFNDSKYAKWYASIIFKARKRWSTRPTNVCAEKHHIIPKSFGGLNEEWNYAFLTPREHFICHLLLQKAAATKYQQLQMRLALRYMIRRPGYETLPTKSRLYLELREAHRELKLLHWSDPANRATQSARVKAVWSTKVRSSEEIEKALNGSRNYWSSVTAEEKQRIYDARKKTAHNRGRVSYFDPNDYSKFGLHVQGGQPIGWVRGDPSLWENGAPSKRTLKRWAKLS